MPAHAKRPTIATVFQLDLSDMFPGEDYWVHACGKRHRIEAHTAQTRAAARNAWPNLRAIPDERLTHYTPDAVTMPADRAVRVHVKHTLKTLAWAKAATSAGNATICIPPRAPREPADASGAQHCEYIDYVTTAKTLVFHHPDLICVDTAASTTIHDYMNNDKAISLMFETLGQQMRDMGPPTEASGWATLEPFTPPANDQTGFDGKTTYYSQMPTDVIQQAAGAVMTAMMKATKNDLTLQGKKWTLETGTSVAPSTPPNLAAAPRAHAGDDDWQPALQNTGMQSGLTAQITVLNAAANQLQLTLTNNYIRYLGAYVRFFDSGGNAMQVPNWTPDGGADIATTIMDIQYDDLRYLGYVGPMNNVMAVPFGPPGTLTVGITFPPHAASAAIYGSGLGTGSNQWPKTPLIGGLLTGIVDLSIPAFLLAAGTAAQAFGPAYTIVQQLLKETPFIVGVLVPVAQFLTPSGSHWEMKMNWGAFTGLFKALFSKAATQLLLWVEGQLAADEAAEEIPFAGWIMVAINISLGIAQLAETIIEVATSDWNITNTISITITTQVTLHPDPRNGAFPQPTQGESATYTVKMIYQDQTRPTVANTYSVPPDFIGTTLPASFAGNTLGGQVKFEADFYVGDWLAAKATTGWMSNDADTVAQLDMYLVEFPVPLNGQSIYLHSSLLIYADNAYQWHQTPTAPIATVADTNTSPTGNAISEWSGLTLSQRAGMIGFAWKAAGTGLTSCVSGAGGQLFAMQNIDVPGVPMNALKFPSCGLDGQTLLVYDAYPPKFLMGKDGQWVLDPVTKHPIPDPADLALGNYYVDPRKAANPTEQDGGYHLRLVALDDTTPFNMGTNLPSYGRCMHQPDSIALHPSGHFIAINREHKKIQVGKLELSGADDAELPLARVYAGESLAIDRHGLIFYPVAVSCSYDGTILVLEDTKSDNANTKVVLARIQAFDLRGRPVNRFFDANGKPSPFLVLSTTGENTYLDLAVVGDQKLTYMYVLYYTGDGSLPSDYNMAIYQYGNTAPVTSPLLVTTTNIAAAKIAVDLWHTAYTLNYAMMTDGQGNPAGPIVSGTAVRTVPSVSEWMPPTKSA
jgi:hypothetical protein